MIVVRNRQGNTVLTGEAKELVLPQNYYFEKGFVIEYIEDKVVEDKVKE